MMRHLGLLGHGGLCRTDIHVSVELARINVDDLRVKRLRNRQRKSRFAHCSGTDYHQEWLWHWGNCLYVQCIGRLPRSSPLHCTLCAPRHPEERRQKGTRGRTPCRLLLVNHLTQFFTSLKKWHTLRWNLYGITSFGIASFAGIALADTKTPKATQLHLVPFTQSLCDTIQQNVDDRFSLFLRELNLVSDLLDELCLCHAFRSPQEGTYRTVTEPDGNIATYSHPGSGPILPLPKMSPPSTPQVL